MIKKICDSTPLKQFWYTEGEVVQKQGVKGQNALEDFGFF